MNIRGQFWLFIVSLVLFMSASVQGQEMSGQSAGRNVGEMKFVTIPPLPTCTQGSVQSGDPSNGPSIIFAKMSTGCSIPWHWHTPGEHLMIVSGVAHVEMKDSKPLTIRAGGFALMPSHHIHQFHCDLTCLFYVYSDAAFDMHYVSEEGTEISPAVALKAVKETVAAEMK